MPPGVHATPPSAAEPPLDPALPLAPLPPAPEPAPTLPELPAVPLSDVPSPGIDEAPEPLPLPLPASVVEPASCVPHPAIARIAEAAQIARRPRRARNSLEACFTNGLCRAEE
jgi:hypothetical protein